MRKAGRDKAPTQNPTQNPTKIRAVVFDLDGTLVDTEPAAAAAVLRCFERWGIKIDESDARYLTGRTWGSAVAFFLSKYEIPLRAEDAQEEMLKEYRAVLDSELCVVKGSVQAIKSLTTKYPLGLVSGSHRNEIFWALGNLGVTSCFKIVLGAQDYARSKPEPDGYLKAVDMLGALPSETLVFEDSEAGIASARAAGAWVVAITSTNHFGQDTSLAHREIKDLTCVNAEWVDKLSGSLF